LSPPQEEDPVKAVDEALFGKDEDMPEVEDTRIQPDYAPPLNVEFTPEEAFPKIENTKGEGVDNQFKILDGVSEGVETELAEVRKEIVKRKGKVVVTPAPFPCKKPIVTVEPADKKLPAASKPVKKTSKKKK
jgi:hypothetical protein